MLNRLKRWLSHKLRASWKIHLLDIEEHNRWLVLNAPAEVLESLYAYRQLNDELLRVSLRQKKQLAIYTVLMPPVVEACKPFLKEDDWMDIASPEFRLGLALETLEINTRSFSKPND